MRAGTGEANSRGGRSIAICGCPDALRRVDQWLAEGRTWVVDVDITRYFDTIPHQKLMEEVEKKIADPRVLI